MPKAKREPVEDVVLFQIADAERRLDLEYPVENLPTNSLLPGPAPSAAFVKDIKLRGVRSPIVLRDQGNRIEVLEGRRRIKAARLAKQTVIPAIIFTGMTDIDAHGWIVASNALRSNNDATDLGAIQKLIAAGYDDDDIRLATGAPKLTVDKVRRLAELTPGLLKAFNQGKITSSVAYSLVKLGKARQVAAETILADKGRVSTVDVEGLRVARATEQARSQSLPNMDVPVLSEVGTMRTLYCVYDDGLQLAKVFSSLTEAMGTCNGHNLYLMQRIA